MCHPFFFLLFFSLGTTIGQVVVASYWQSFWKLRIEFTRTTMGILLWGEKNKESEFWSNSQVFFAHYLQAVISVALPTSLFLTTYQANNLITVCSLRNASRMRFDYHYGSKLNCLLRLQKMRQNAVPVRWAWKLAMKMYGHDGTIVSNEKCIQTHCIFILRELSDLQQSLTHLTATSSTKKVHAF